MLRRLFRRRRRDGSRLVIARMPGNTTQDMAAYAIAGKIRIARVAGVRVPAQTVEEMRAELKRCGLTDRDIDRDRERLQQAIDRLNGRA